MYRYVLSRYQIRDCREAGETNYLINSRHSSALPLEKQFAEQLESARVIF